MDYQWKEADNRKRKEGMEKERRGMSYLSQHDYDDSCGALKSFRESLQKRV